MTVWRKGMKAVCIKDKGWTPLESDMAVLCQYPEHQKIYTVNSVDSIDGVTYLTLDEFQEVPEGRLLPPGFDAEAFRPAVSRSTDISIFKALLRDPHKHITEDA